jgi:hypothetical protein
LNISRHASDRSDVTDALFTRCLYTESNAAPDLLIRTSGETRLSDFFLHQACGAHTQLKARGHVGSIIALKRANVSIIIHFHRTQTQFRVQQEACFYCISKFYVNILSRYLFCSPSLTDLHIGPSDPHPQFLPALWPDLSLWDLARCVLEWQSARPHIEARQRSSFSWGGGGGQRQ